LADAYGVELPGADPGSAARVKAFAAALMRALPRVTRTLAVPTPRQTLDQHLDAVVATFCFHSALPHLVQPHAFVSCVTCASAARRPHHAPTVPTQPSEQWRLLMLILLKSLGAHRMPALGAHLAVRGAPPSIFASLLLPSTAAPYCLPGMLTARGVVGRRGGGRGTGWAQQVGELVRSQLAEAHTTQEQLDTLVHMLLDPVV
jgi:hypothetical protein